MQQFLRYARASPEEARRRLADGVARGHFAATSCEAAFTHANRCGAATTGLWKSLNLLNLVRHLTITVTLLASSQRAVRWFRT